MHLSQGEHVTCSELQSVTEWLSYKSTQEAPNRLLTNCCHMTRQLTAHSNADDKASAPLARKGNRHGHMDLRHQPAQCRCLCLALHLLPAMAFWQDQMSHHCQLHRDQWSTGMQSCARFHLESAPAPLLCQPLSAYPHILAHLNMFSPHIRLKSTSLVFQLTGSQPRLPVGLEAPIMTPNGVIFLLFFFFFSFFSFVSFCFFSTGSQPQQQ